MSAKVDLERKLTEDEITYLISRDKWVELAYSARTYGTELPDAARATIRAHGYSLEGESTPEEAPAKSAAVSDDVSTPEGGTEQTGPAKYSEEWFDGATVAILKEELAKRQQAVTGKRDELADRLYGAMIDSGELKEDEA